MNDKVLQAWQIDSSRVSFGPLSAELFDKLKAEIQEEIGLPDIELVFYKLLVYEAGGQFSAHRDTLRGERHIGSVIVSLPGFQCTGGELLVRSPHLSSVEVLTVTETWAGQTGEVEGSYAAFFTDCVTSDRERIPRNAGFKMHYTDSIKNDLYLTTGADAVMKKCRQFVKEILKHGREDLVIPLRHQYSELTNPAQQLKSTDLIVFQVVIRWVDHLTHHSAVNSCSVIFEITPYDEFTEDPPDFTFTSSAYIRRRLYAKEYFPFVVMGSDGAEQDFCIYNADDEDNCFRVMIERYKSARSSRRPKTWHPCATNSAFLFNNRSGLNQVNFEEGSDHVGNEPAPDTFTYRHWCRIVQERAAMAMNMARRW